VRGEPVRRFFGPKSSGKRQWHLGHVLAVVSVGLLAALLTPGCAWLFGFNRANLTQTVEPGGGPHGGGLVYPTPEPVVTHEPSVFITAAPGYRSLGGIFVYDGTLMIVTPDLFPDPAHANDEALALAFGHLVAAHHIDPLRGLTADACIGDGDGPATPIQPQKVVAPEDEVGAGIACVRLRNPGAHWIASRLMANDRHAVAFVWLERNDGSRVGAYTDVTRFAWQRGVLK